MKTDQMRQCTIEKKSGNETRTRLSWIPEEFAQIGKVVKLKDGDEWSDGWIVKKVPGFSLSEDTVSKLERQHVNHRKTTDI